MTIELNWWTIAFILTLAVVVLLVSYIRFLLKQLTFVSTNLTELNNEAISFAAHLKSVYELEAFYGDETLNGLLEHSIHFTSKVDKFSGIMDLTAEPIDEDEEEETEDFDDEAENKPQPQINQEILYAGTRRRNS